MTDDPPELNPNLSIHDDLSPQYQFPGQQQSPQLYSEHDKNLFNSNHGPTAASFAPELGYGNAPTAHADHAAGWAVHHSTMEGGPSSFADHHSTVLAARAALGSPLATNSTSQFAPLGGRNLDRTLAPELPFHFENSAAASNQQHGHIFVMGRFDSDRKAGESAFVEVSAHEDQNSVSAMTAQSQKSRASKKQKQTKVVEASIEVQREIKLERNRQAASRCRVKKKEWADQLEEQLRTLSTEHARLTMHHNILRDQVIHLKTMLLQHCDCHCERIRDYLKDGLQ